MNSDGDSWLRRHLHQDGTLMGTLIAFGVASLFVLAAVIFALDPELDVENDHLFAYAVVFGAAMGLPGVVVFLARLFRRETNPSTKCGTCSTVPATEVRYLQCSAVVVVAFVAEVRFSACRSCSLRAFSSTTAKTLLLGWWSFYSPLVVPWILVNNVAFLLKHLLGTRSGGRAALHALEEQRVYAQNLLRTKPFDDVVAVLGKQTGLPAKTVADYLHTIE